MRNYKLALDAGHGLYTSGKRIPEFLIILSNWKKYREFWLNRRIARLTIKRIKKSGLPIDVVKTYDESGVTDVTLPERCNIANESDADLFLSIHHDAHEIDMRYGEELAYESEFAYEHCIGTEPSGITVFWNSANPNRENEANELYKRLINQTGLSGNRAVPVQQTKNLYVLNHTNMKAFLCELGFMTSKIDVPIITTLLYAKKVSKALFNFVKADYRKWVKENEKVTI